MTAVLAALEVADQTAVTVALITAGGGALASVLGLAGVVVQARSVSRRLGTPRDGDGEPSTVATQLQDMTGHLLTLSETVTGLDRRVDTVEQVTAQVHAVQVACGECPRIPRQATAPAGGN